jgi:hypothetical protein
MPELIKNTIVFLSAHPILLIVFGYFCLNFKECNWNTPSVFQNDAIQVHTMATTLLIICASIFSWGADKAWVIFMFGLMVWLMLWSIVFWVLLEFKKQNLGKIQKILKVGKVIAGTSICIFSIWASIIIVTAIIHKI